MRLSILASFALIVGCTVAFAQSAQDSASTRYTSGVCPQGPQRSASKSSATQSTDPSNPCANYPDEVTCRACERGKDTPECKAAYAGLQERIGK